MKRIIITLIVLMPWCLRASDNPQIINSKTKTIETVDWYQSQAASWLQQISANKKNATAWVNYYLSSRYAQNSVDALNKITNDAWTAIPATFEANLIKGINAGFTIEAGEALKSAYAIHPNNVATYSPLLMYYEYSHDAFKRKEFSSLLFSSDELSQSLLNYSYNVLMSLERGAILFTEGDNTTLPLLVLQDVMNVRNDVLVLNLDMLQEDSYRDAKLKANSLSFEGELSSMMVDSRKVLCTDLPEQNQSRKFYYALTLSQENITPIKNQLYVVGLASLRSKNKIDNVATIRKNFEDQFLLDYLSVDFNGESKSASGKVLSANYLVPMLMLDQHYLKSGEIEKSKELEDLVMKLATQSNKTELVQNFLNRERTLVVPYFKYALNMKETEGTQKPVKGNIYANEYEVTNKQYNEFLTFLKDNNLMQHYDKFKFDLSSFTEPALTFMKNYSTPRAPYKKNKFFTDHPAVSVTFEGANAYCEWLTGQYNAQENRKFKKVQFRLPTIQEWQIAALGFKEFQSWTLAENKVKMFKPNDPTAEISKDGAEIVVPFNESDARYPWYYSYNYRNTVVNKHGCMLGNFKFDDKVTECMKHNHMPTADGFTMMSPVGAYFPNGMGLYDVVGNVAEMTNEKGKACGGSWNHTPEESTIESVNTYEGADIAVGFRVFMEVLEQ